MLVLPVFITFSKEFLTEAILSVRGLFITIKNVAHWIFGIFNSLFSRVSHKWLFHSYTEFPSHGPSESILSMMKPGRSLRSWTTAHGFIEMTRQSVENKRIWESDPLKLGSATTVLQSHLPLSVEKQNETKAFYQGRWRWKNKSLGSVSKPGGRLLARRRLLAHPRSRRLLGHPPGACLPSPDLSLGIKTAEGNQPEQE